MTPTATGYADQFHLDPARVTAVLAAHPDLQHLTTLDELTTSAHHNPDAVEVNRILGALLQLAAATGGDNPDAATLLLKLLAHGLAATANRLHWLADTPAERRELMWSEAFLLIRSCTWWHARTKIASNLINDTKNRLWRAAGLRRDSTNPIRTATPLDHGDLAELTELATTDQWDTPAGQARLEVISLLTRAHRTGVITSRETRLLVEHHLRELAATDIAAWYGIAPSSVERTARAVVAKLRRAV